MLFFSSSKRGPRATGWCWRGVFDELSGKILLGFQQVLVTYQQKFASRREVIIT